MFSILGIIVGITIILGLLWAAVVFVPSIIYMTFDLIRTIIVEWSKAFKEGWDEAGE
jgi:hypothetical protein